MIPDIHWTIERLHPDSTWHAVLSDVRVFDINPGRTRVNGPVGAAEDLCRRNSSLFAESSGLEKEGRDAPIATPGLPGDASDYTRDYLGNSFRIIPGIDASKPAPFHTHGHLTWARVHPDNPEWAGRQYDCGVRLGRTLAQMELLLEREILFGKVCTNTPGPRHPDMDAASNHAMLAVRRRLDTLTPINPNTVRLIVAYENSRRSTSPQ